LISNRETFFFYWVGEFGKLIELNWRKRAVNWCRDCIPFTEEEQYCVVLSCVTVVIE
jgi:hypothetical protein